MTDDDQLFIPGTEPPPDPDLVPEVDERVRLWLDARVAAKDAAEDKTTAEHRLMVELVERGLDRYPYTDPVTGKRRYFVADRTPKAKTMAAPSGAKPKRRRDAQEVEARADAAAERVEVRRVSRRSVAAEIGESGESGANASDPFAATREKLAERAQDDAEQPTPTSTAPSAPKRKARR